MSSSSKLWPPLMRRLQPPTPADIAIPCEPHKVDAATFGLFQEQSVPGVVLGGQPIWILNL